MSSVVAPSRGSRRLPVLVLAIAVIAGGVAAGRAHVSVVAAPARVVDATQLPPKGALSTAWYCPGLPAAFPLSDQTVTLSNTGPSARAVLTVQPDNGAAAVSHAVTVPHDSVLTIQRSTLPNGPLVVEPLSSDVVVSAGLETGDALATVPCADTVATDWYFAAGTTVRGVSQWLVLEDPFSADARVDITLRTDAGIQVLPSLSGVDVPGRSRVIIAIHNEAVRRTRVAVEVHAAVGRVVAAQTLRFSTAAGTPGVATSIGAIAPSSAWWFTDGDTRAGASNWVAIADVGELDARVNVQAQAGAKVIVRPIALTVPAGGVQLVRIGGCSGSGGACLAVPSGTGFVLEVHSDDAAPVVAQTLSRFEGGGSLGAATSMGSTTPALTWTIPRTRALGQRSTSIALTDTGVEPAHVSVQIIHGGHVDRPAGLQRLTIAPGARIGVSLASEPVLRRVDAAVVVTSDVPIFAEATIYSAGDATRSPGIPSR